MTAPLDAALPSDQLFSPLNAPRAAPVSPGVQPGVTNAIVLAQYVVVFGASGGVFVYSGTPALGNPPVYWFGNVTADPYGNSLDQGIWAGQNGNIQVGIQANAGHAQIFFVPAGGTYAADASAGMVQSGGQAILEIAGAQTAAVPAANSDRVLLELWDHGAGTTASLIAFYFDSAGVAQKLFAGNYQGMDLPIVSECLAIRPGTGTGPSNAAQSEIWNTITMDSGWSTIAGYDSPRYRLLPDGLGTNGSIQLSGSAQFTGTIGNPQSLNSNNPLPSAYRPSNNHYYRSGDSHRMGAQLDNSGVIDGYPVSGGFNQIALDGVVSLQ